MFSALSSLIWGTPEEEITANSETKTTVGPADEHVELENDWIYIQQKEKKLKNPKRKTAHFDDSASTTSEASHVGMEESWLVTPPQCFNSKLKQAKPEVSPMENLLIEHPSMSIYHDNKEVTEETPSSGECVPSKCDNHKAVAGRLLALEKRQPLKDLSKSVNNKKQNTAKNVKRRNQVYIRQHTARKNKQYGRMSGKHTAVVGKRAA